VSLAILLNHIAMLSEMLSAIRCIVANVTSAKQVQSKVYISFGPLILLGRLFTNITVDSLPAYSAACDRGHGILTAILFVLLLISFYFFPRVQRG
jgi:hypothetical protein